MPQQPPIADYAFISDCHSTALVSCAGSIDWCCMPAIDSESFFGRLLDWEVGGYCSIAPHGEYRVRRRYLGDSLVLETTFTTPHGQARLIDCFAMREGGANLPHRQLMRVVEGLSGEVPLLIQVEPVFDYGELRPWLLPYSTRSWAFIGGDQGVHLWTDFELRPRDHHGLEGALTIKTGQRLRLSLQFKEPHLLYPDHPEDPTAAQLDRRLSDTLEWWQSWASKGTEARRFGEEALRSAVVMKGLTYAPTGAIAAAATTSLPEGIGGERNWDYRYSWIRDSAFVVESLGDLGFHSEAHRFRLFIERTTAGSVKRVQPMYGITGRHLLPEMNLEFLSGYHGSRPVRIGNDAYQQVQLDAYGELLDLAWRAALRGYEPSAFYWTFLADVVTWVCKGWRDPDRGIWEVRRPDLHFVHSKASCWAAIDRGIRMAERLRLPAPLDTWRTERDELRHVIETEGYDRERGVFVQRFGAPDLDAALLLLPRTGLVHDSDPRMVRTADAIARELGTKDGLIRRYLSEDGLSGDEGVFLCCSFWLALCLAAQGRTERAREIFTRVSALANDVGLYAEEYDPRSRQLLGNYPQGLTHYSHVLAAVALARCEAALPTERPPDIRG